MDFLSVLYYLHPTTFIIFIFLAVISIVRTGMKSHITYFYLHIVISLSGIYLLGLTIICSDPYFFDGGNKEFITWGNRWSWAVPYASGLEVILFPIAFIIAKKVMRRRQSK